MGLQLGAFCSQCMSKGIAAFSIFTLKPKSCYTIHSHRRKKEQTHGIGSIATIICLPFRQFTTPSVSRSIHEDSAMCMMVVIIRAFLACQQTKETAQSIVQWPGWVISKDSTRAEDTGTRSKDRYSADGNEWQLRQENYGPRTRARSFSARRVSRM